jgi:glucose/arabinose dehydrogenase
MAVMTNKLLAALSPLVLLAASCGPTAAGESPKAGSEVAGAFTVTELAQFNEPWAIALLAGTPYALISEKSGKLKLWQAGGPVVDVAGVPAVAYGGQGGLGDVKAVQGADGAWMVYLTWAEAGAGDTRGAAAGRAALELGNVPQLGALEVFWRQQPKVTGKGHYSHRLAFAYAPDQLYIASGDRQKLTPAQDLASDLGKILRFDIAADGKLTRVPGYVSSGHRNILGMKFDAIGRLWDLEHGPAGGDELNLVKSGANYGWPVVSEGDHYDGKSIPRHSSRPDLAAPAISWNPVIAPGDFIFYSGKMWPEWKGDALIAGLASAGLVRVRIDGEMAREEARYPLDNRIRAIAEAADGSLYVLEDGDGGRLMRLSRK